MADVFVSYKREDDQKVGRLVKALRGAGLEAWWDRDIPTGAPWEETIEREHGLAKCLIVCWSKASVQSENVKAEARKARAAGTLVQTFIEPCEPPMFFGERQGIDLTGWTGKADDPRVQALINAVRATIEGRAADTGVGAATGRAKGISLPLLLAGGVVLAALIGGAIWFVARPGDDKKAPAAPTAEARTLAAVNGKWGLENTCDRTYRYSVVKDATGSETRIVAESEGIRAEGRVVSVSSGVVLTEALTPVEDRGKLVDIRPEPTQLTLQDRAEDTRLVLVRCP